MYKYFNITQYNLSFLQENIEFYSYAIISFLIPFLLGHPQWLVGTIVNTALILGALNLKFNKLLPIIVLPSIAVLSAGLIFGNSTSFLIYLIPFIWISNLLLVWITKYFNIHKKKNYFTTLALSSVSKSLFLFISVGILIYFNLIPMNLLIPFSLLQLGTAFSGGILAFGIQKVKY